LRLTSNIKQNELVINKHIEDNEKALETMKAAMQNAQTPESVIQKVVEDIKTHITSLHDQLRKWNTHKEKLNALPASGGS